MAYASGGSAWGINCASSNTVNIQNNIIGGIDVTGTTSSTASGFIGIDASGTGLFSINNNSVGNDLPDNIRTGYLLTGANLSTQQLPLRLPAAHRLFMESEVLPLLLH